ncbi:hypothetical protein E2I00_018298 [Balaenoptera physalus]|uniref:DDHD domain-containing protein n=1 Tax=Balaenoptera physalus TaxID=9770 RepID=A0A643CK70_BALPH|nr:hypothetical protein E2I00_018298 [Balaenoptera physalus]
MIIKEYRIPLPMTVEEYRIAQLYMIQAKWLIYRVTDDFEDDRACDKPEMITPPQMLLASLLSAFFNIYPMPPINKKSRNETFGEGSGVEILENRPYTDGPGGSGQYTHKVYHVGMHIPSWFRSILPKAALRVVEESWNAYPYTRTRFTCPFVEKFSIDIETFYKTDAGENPNVFSLSPVEKNQLTIDFIDIVKDPVPPNEYKTEEDPKLFYSTKTQRGPLSENWIEEYKQQVFPIMCAYKLCKWYGLNMDNIRELEKEAQLMLSRKMAQFNEDDKGAAELAKDEATQDQAPREPPQPSSSASPSRHSISEWRMQSIARDSDESSDDEFFDAHEDLSDSEEMFPKDITKWNSNDLMDKIESPEPEDTQGNQRGGCRLQPPKEAHPSTQEGWGDTSGPACHDGLYRQSAPEFRVASSVEQLNIIELPKVETAPLGTQDPLSPYSHDEGCLSSSQDHVPLAALPLLATSSPHYQEAVATVIQRANLAYGDFIKSQEGVTFNGQVSCGVGEGKTETLQGGLAWSSRPGLSPASPPASRVGSQAPEPLPLQVCLIGDCVGGILAYDALCCSNQTASESQSSSRRGSVASVQVLASRSPRSRGPPGWGLSPSGSEHPRGLQKKGRAEAANAGAQRQGDTDLLSPGTTVNAAHGGNLESSRHLSRSNIDIPRSSGAEDPRQQLPRKRSDSSTYELDTIQQHRAFLSRWVAGPPARGGGALRDGSEGRTWARSCRRPTSTMLDGAGAVGKFDFEIADLFLFGLETFLIAEDGSTRLGPRMRVRLPKVAVFQLRPACQQVYNLFHPADPDGFLETSIPVPALTWQDGPRPSPGSAEGGSCLWAEPGLRGQVSPWGPAQSQPLLLAVAAKWWGQKRIDYALYCPDALTAFPTVALPHLFHASYWESTDVVSFLLRQVMRHDNSSILELDGKEVSVFTPSKPREKWQRKRTHVKLRVDVHIMMQPPSGEWLYLDTLVTNSSGRVSYTIPETHRLGVGVYPVKMVVRYELRGVSRPGQPRPGREEGALVGSDELPPPRGDHTFADSYITVLPKGTEFVVFSIDGSFAASVSIMGSDPKVRAGAVDVVRHWQDLGYLIIYVTGRPDMQKQRVVAWLAQHNFPHGVVSFCDGLVHDPLRHKANFLKLLISELQRGTACFLLTRVTQLLDLTGFALKFEGGDPSPSPMATDPLTQSPGRPAGEAESQLWLSPGQPLCCSSTFSETGEPAGPQPAVQRPGSFCEKLLPTWIRPQGLVGWDGEAH